MFLSNPTKKKNAATSAIKFPRCTAGRCSEPRNPFSADRLHLDMHNQQKLPHGGAIVSKPPTRRRNTKTRAVRNPSNVVRSHGGVSNKSAAAHENPRSTPAPLMLPTPDQSSTISRSRSACSHLSAAFTDMLNTANSRTPEPGTPERSPSVTGNSVAIARGTCVGNMQKKRFEAFRDDSSTLDARNQTRHFERRW